MSSEKVWTSDSIYCMRRDMMYGGAPYCTKMRNVRTIFFWFPIFKKTHAQVALPRSLPAASFFVCMFSSFCSFLFLFLFFVAPLSWLFFWNFFQRIVNERQEVQSLLAHANIFHKLYHGCFNVDAAVQIFDPLVSSCGAATFLCVPP